MLVGSTQGKKLFPQFKKNAELETKIHKIFSDNNLTIKKFNKDNNKNIKSVPSLNRAELESVYKILLEDPLIRKLDADNIDAGNVQLASSSTLAPAKTPDTVQEEHLSKTADEIADAVHSDIPKHVSKPDLKGKAPKFVSNTEGYPIKKLNEAYENIQSLKTLTTDIDPLLVNDNNGFGDLDGIVDKNYRNQPTTNLNTNIPQPIINGPHADNAVYPAPFPPGQPPFNPGTPFSDSQNPRVYADPNTNELQVQQPIIGTIAETMGKILEIQNATPAGKALAKEKEETLMGLLKQVVEWQQAWNPVQTEASQEAEALQYNARLQPKDYYKASEWRYHKYLEDVKKENGIFPSAQDYILKQKVTLNDGQKQVVYVDPPRYSVNNPGQYNSVSERVEAMRAQKQAQHAYLHRLSHNDEMRKKGLLHNNGSFMHPY